MMPVIYKIATKVVAFRLSPILDKVITPHQHGFIKGRSIYDNILVAMIGIDYAKLMHQECILLQLDLNKAYDRIGWSWSFISRTMRKVGIGLALSSVMFHFGMGGTYQLLSNRRIVGSFEIHTSAVRQGCPLAPLLFAIYTHPLAKALQSVAQSGVLSQAIL